MTVLFPFLQEVRIDTHVCAAIADALAGHQAFDVRFETCGRFPGILYLVPEPDTQLRQLTQAIADRWPEAPPFEGQFTDLVPHLTIAQHQEPGVLDDIEAALADSLPITARVSTVDLMVHDGRIWRQRASFALQGC
ncbi:2'-5' RNA ligase [Kitasatospora sp. GAS1066B]